MSDVVYEEIRPHSEIPLIILSSYLWLSLPSSVAPTKPEGWFGLVIACNIKR